MTWSHSSLLLVLPAAVAVAGLGLIVYALRGRRVDDHPLCRRCGFDLFGKPEAAGVCSECGADLARPRAVRVGHRRTRRRLMAVTLPAVLVCVAWLGLLGWGAWRGTDWNQHKPVWWLMHDARGADAGTRDLALAELARRTPAGKLSRQQVDALVDLALERQADRSRPWVDGWAGAIGAARDAGRLAPEKWRRYARQGVEVRLEVRPTLRRGDPLVYSFVPAATRLAPWHSFDLTYEPRQVRDGGRPLTRHHDYSASGIVSGGNAYPFDVKVSPAGGEALAALPDGPHTLRATVSLRVADAPGRGLGYLVDEEVELTAPVTLLPAGAQAVKLRTDPELGAAVRKAFTADPLVVDETTRYPELLVNLRATRPPVGAAFRVYARTSRGEWELGTVHFSAGATTTYPIRTSLERLRGFDRRTLVEVVLRPSIDVALATLDLTEIWGGEVVTPPVGVYQMRKPASPPAAEPEVLKE